MTIKGYLLVMFNRAQATTESYAREELAVGLRRLVREANEPPTPGLRLHAYRPAIARAERELRLLASRLQGPRPVDAEGVARARALLTDGTGPLYNPHRAAGLPDAIRDAV